MEKKQNDFYLDDVLSPEVMEVYFYGKTSKREIFISSLSASSLEKSVPEGEKVRGGKTNAVHYVLTEGGDVKLTITDIYHREDLFSKKMGTDIENIGEKTVYSLHMPKVYTIGVGKKITLDNEPIDSTEVSIYDISTKKLIDPSKYTITNKDITFTDLNEGSAIKTGGFRYKAKSTDKTMTITADSSNEEMFVVAECDVLNKALEVVYKKKYIFPKCTMSSNYKIDQKTKMAEVSDETVVTPLFDDSINGVGYVVIEYPETV